MGDRVEGSDVWNSTSPLTGKKFIQAVRCVRLNLLEAVE